MNNGLSMAPASASGPASGGEFPSKLRFLFQPARYKIMYGGRGSGKSWGAARALLVLGAQRPIKVLCTRELQHSIADSVHAVLKDQIDKLGLGSAYVVEKARIKGTNGTEFFFEGVKFNINKIKSYEGIDYCWVEEAHTVSKTSWEVLIPTIRKDGSEIWVTFNPELETDETYVRFVRNPPPSAVTCKVNWRDNPWFTQVLLDEMEDLRARDPDAYLHVYEGQCRQNLEGAVYAKELRAATAEGRICAVPYERGVGVDTFWDLGRADATAIWFSQRVAFEWRIIDYYENSQFSLDHYIEVIQAKRYLYRQHWLPHDARAKTLGTKRSVEEQLRDSVSAGVRIVPRLSLADGINAVRQLLPRCWFDQDACADGLQALRHYRYAVTPGTTTLSDSPLHDWASHAADAFRYLALGLKEPKRPRQAEGGLVKKLRDIFSDGALDPSQGWMGN